MRKYNIQKMLTLSCMALAFALLFACQKDEVNTDSIVAYLPSGNAAYNVNISNITILDNIFSGDEDAKFPVLITRPFTTDIQVTAQIDTSLIKQYDKENGVVSLPLPAESFTLENISPVTIKAGQISSVDSIKVAFKNSNQIKRGVNSYIVPVVLTAASNNVPVSNARHIMYLKVVVNYVNIDDSGTPVTGTTIDRTNPAWTVVNTSTPYNSTTHGVKALDGNNSTHWFSTGANSFITLDMGASNVIKGFILTPSYGFGAPYNATSIEVQTSTDNVTWINQGTYTAAAVRSSSSATSPDYRNINFYAPVTCRYVKFTNTVVPNTYSGFAEINAIK